MLCKVYALRISSGLADALKNQTPIDHIGEIFTISPLITAVRVQRNGWTDRQMDGRTLPSALGHSQIP